MTTRNRGRSNGNESGNSAQRRNRKHALLCRDGNGSKAPCWECGALVDATTIFVDRIIPGVDGGTYDLNNCRVHCRPCSGRQGQRMTIHQRARMKAFRDEQTRGRGVKFKTETLRRAVESAVTQSEIQHNRTVNAAREAYERKAAQHAEEHNSAWEASLPKIRRAIRANKPITIDMIPGRRRGWNGEAEVFVDKPPNETEFIVPDDLRVMRNALRLVVDDVVTTTALKELGVNASILRTVCTLAVEEDVKQQTEKKISPNKPKASSPRRRVSDQKPETATLSVITIPQEESVS